MNAIVGGVVGLFILFLGMALSNGIGLLLGFIGGMLIRLTLITLQWEGVYVLGISSCLLFPSLIESNPFVIMGMVIGGFAIEPLSVGMKYITGESSSLEIGGDVQLEQLTRDGRVPTHMYAFYGLLVMPVVMVIVLLGLEETLEVLKTIAFPLSGFINLGMWVYKVHETYQEGGGRNVSKLVVGIGLSIGVTVSYVFLYSGTDLSIYGVILPLVLMTLPIGKKSMTKQEVLPGILCKNGPMHEDNITTCIAGGLLNSILISTSQRLVTKRMTQNPYNQYGIEAVGTYIQFALYWVLGWGKSGETAVIKVIESYQSLDTGVLMMLMGLIIGVLIYTLTHTREVMVFLLDNKKDYSKTIGEVLCLVMCLCLVIQGPNVGLGIGLMCLCLLVNTLVKKNVIPSEAMMGALLFPFFLLLS